MSYFGKEVEEKIWEAVHKIDHLNIEDNDMHKQTIYDIIENFGKWLHQRTCYRMIDIL